MLIYITVKSLGRRKNWLTRQPLQLTDTPGTLRELITCIVEQNVRQFREKQTDTSFIPYLTTDTIEEQAHAGKVGFEAVRDDRVPEEQQAVETALLAFEDGLYKVFLREQEVTGLEEQIQLAEGDEAAFIRLTMLAGRMW
ncbi:hypothetical protein [Paenibacillus bovis]|uniref:Uncharacterized protein n=1 Tax=Paenibacillus bovis TaxID=1616788 RepID=A0A172ZAY4_9BACL|nr:hypothetical protein [Paenibacillus bovis]ANF94778.1 hypothetical protein AR543_01170 [Paenibacillus bovis]